MNNFKYQTGMEVPQMPMDTAALSQMMSEQGAGQGMDFNGAPTPNISGQPSFADMYQEIKKRYDTLILPLERQLMKLKKKLEENPTDETIKNEIKRIEEKIDRLEQQEDMEIQQLEVEVEKSGQMIDQQKEEMGMPPQEEEMPESMPLAEQQMPQEGMAMMQGGGIVPKKQIGEKISDWWKHDVVPAFTRDMGFDAPWMSEDHSYNAQDFVRDYNQAMEQAPVAARVVQWNPILGLGAAAMNLYSQAKGYRNDNEFVNNLSRAAMGFMPAMKAASAPAALRGLAGYAGLNAGANTLANQQLEKQGYAPTYDKGFSGFMNDAYGIPTWLGELGAMVYGGNKLGMRSGNLYSGGAPAGARAETIVQKVKNKYGANWRKIEGLDTYTDRTSAGNTKLWERLENGELEIVDNGNGGHVIREAKNPKVSAERAATAETSAEAQNTTGVNPREKMTDKEYFEDVRKGTKENWQKVKSAAGTGAVTVLKDIGRPVVNLLGTAVNYIGNPLMRAFSLRRPVDVSRNIFEIPTGKKFFLEFPEWRRKEIYTTMPVSHTMRGVNMFRNSLNAAGTAATRIGFPLMGYNLFSSFFRDNTNEAYNEEKQNNAINEYKSSAASGTITPLSSATGSASENDTVKADVKDTMQNTNETPQEILDALKKFNITQDKEVPTKQLGGWFDSLLKDIDEKHPSGIKGYLKAVPWTQHVMMGNMLGNVLDMSGKNNIEAQHQFRYANNPYTQVYDRANREYNQQMNEILRKYDLDDLRLSRQKQYPQYSSLQHMNHARLAQSEIDNTNRMTNMSNRMTSIQNVANVFGKPANDAFQNMYEQNYKNAILNENERKSYLSAINKYNNEKTAAYNNVINMMALAGKEQKRNDMLYGEVMKNYLTGLKMGIDGNLLYAALKPFFQNLDLPQQPVQNGK